MSTGTPFPSTAFVNLSPRPSFAAPVLNLERLRSRRLQLLKAANEGGAPNEQEEVDPKDLTSLNVFNAKKNRVRDNRDLLPFHVELVTPPPQRLGVFALDKNTASGDLLEHRLRMFEVKRVRCLYKYRAGIGFVMFKKAAEVVDANRVLEEAYLNRILQISTAAGGDKLERDGRDL